MSDIVSLVIRDLEERKEAGIQRYGFPLTDGADPCDHLNYLYEAYLEALDMAIYLRKELTRRNDAS